MTSSINCIICNKKTLKELTINNKFVSSDIKILKSKARHAICKDCFTIQKILDKKYLSNISKIYKNYNGFEKFNKKDQIKIFNGTFINRCEIIFNQIINKKFKNIKKIIDYGSGNGAMLIPFLASKKKIHLNATDVKDNLSEEIKNSKNFKKFISIENFNKSTERYDLITLIHTLEHLTNPKETLLNLKKKLSSGGGIFIQIPDYSSNPYDLIIYDHTIHYNIDTIKKLANEIKMRIDFISNKILDCEFSFILSKREKISSKHKYSKNSFFNNLDNFNKSKKFLDKQIKNLKNYKNIFILGTSISATWIYASINNQKINFIEEDDSKINLKHLNKKINDIKSNSKSNNFLFLPFPSIKLKKIMKRLKKNYNYKYLFPN